MTYTQARIAIDAVVFTIQDDELRVLLKEREKEPFKGKMELIGGLLEESESAEKTLARKLATLGQQQAYFEQFFTFTDPTRDPRSRTITIGYIALVQEMRVDDATWFSVERLPAMAFDHKQVIAKAHEQLKSRLDSEIVRHFLPSTFPLNQLQKVYECVLVEKQDNRNFRKRMIASGVVVETKERERNVSHRPASLYKFS